VLHIRDCADCAFTLPPDVLLAKLFVERCARCTLALHGRLITGHVEIWGCEDVTLVAHAQLPTLQADLCTRLALRYAARAHLGAVVHAGVRGLRLECDAGADADAQPRLERDIAPPPAQGAPEEEAPADDVQFITRWCERCVAAAVPCRLCEQVCGLT
jgi:hypothetical protein